MHAGYGDPESAAIPGAGTIAVIAALSSERRAILPGSRNYDGWSVRQSGPGPAAARLAAEAAVDAGAAGLVSFGLAGGLVASAPTGVVVLPRRVVNADRRSVEVASAWRDRIATALDGRFDVVDGAVFAAAAPVAATAEKERIASEAGAVAVDMESFAIGEVASAAGIPFVVIRVVVDGYDDALPSGIDAFVTGEGNVRLLGVVLFAIRSIVNLRALRELARRSAIAHSTLRRVAAVVVSSDFARNPRGEQASA